MRVDIYQAGGPPAVGVSKVSGRPPDLTDSTTDALSTAPYMMHYDKAHALSMGSAIHVRHRRLRPDLVPTVPAMLLFLLLLVSPAAAAAGQAVLGPTELRVLVLIFYNACTPKPCQAAQPGSIRTTTAALAVAAAAGSTAAAAPSTGVSPVLENHVSFPRAGTCFHPPFAQHTLSSPGKPKTSHSRAAADKPSRWKQEL